MSQMQKNRQSKSNMLGGNREQLGLRNTKRSRFGIVSGQILSTNSNKQETNSQFTDNQVAILQETEGEDWQRHSESKTSSSKRLPSFMKDDHVEERVNLLPPLVVEDIENSAQSIATPSLNGETKDHRDPSSVVSLVKNRPTSPNNRIASV